MQIKALIYAVLFVFDELGFKLIYHNFVGKITEGLNYGGAVSVSLRQELRSRPQ